MDQTPNNKLQLSQIPGEDASLAELCAFAHTFNGYEAFGSFDDCAEIACLAITAPSSACAPFCSSRHAAGAIVMTPPAPRNSPTAASWWARSVPRSRRAGAEPTAARRSAVQRTLQ